MSWYKKQLHVEIQRKQGRGCGGVGHTRTTLALDRPGIGRSRWRVGSLLLFLLSKASQHNRQFCAVSEGQRREDVRRLVVPALCRPERMIRLCLPIRKLCGMQPSRPAHHERHLQAGRYKELSYMAIP